MLLLVEDYYDSITTSRQENAVNSHLFVTVHSKLHPEALHEQQREKENKDKQLNIHSRSFIASEPKHSFHLAK